ncbi:MAG: site-specific integrase [Chloroflexi bacterium]|nr:site-specific integrase [Chloroflexota bacterium]
MMTSLAVRSAGLSEVEAIIELVLDRLTALTSKAMYRRALLDFLQWYQVAGAAAFDRATVQRYRALLLDAGLAPSTINQKPSAIRALTSEAADNGLLDPQLAAGVSRVRGVPSAGNRTGNWLSQADAQRLLDAPDPTTRKGCATARSWPHSSAAACAALRSPPSRSLMSSSVMVAG